MSFREFLEYEGVGRFPVVGYEELKASHRKLASRICRNLKIIPLFKRYLKSGYYPFYKKSPRHFTDRLTEVVNTVLSVDLPAVEGVTPPTVRKARKMLMVLAKGFGQIKDISDSYVVNDDVEIGVGNKIPLWLFGFLY